MVVVAQPANRLRNWSWVVSYQWGCCCGAAAASAHWLSALSVSVWVLIKNCNQSQAFILSNPLTGGGNLKSWEHSEHFRQTPLAITRYGYLAAIIWRVMNAARWQSANRSEMSGNSKHKETFFFLSVLICHSEILRTKKAWMQMSTLPSLAAMFGSNVKRWGSNSGLFNLITIKTSGIPGQTEHVTPSMSNICNCTLFTAFYFKKRKQSD